MVFRGDVYAVEDEPRRDVQLGKGSQVRVDVLFESKGQSAEGRQERLAGCRISEKPVDIVVGIDGELRATQLVKAAAKSDALQDRPFLESQAGATHLYDLEAWVGFMEMLQHGMRASNRTMSLYYPDTEIEWCCEK